MIGNSRLKLFAVILVAASVGLSVAVRPVVADEPALSLRAAVIEAYPATPVLLKVTR